MTMPTPAPRPRARSGRLLVAAAWLAATAGVLVLMPCLPWSPLHAVLCPVSRVAPAPQSAAAPITPAAPATAAAPAAPAFDFERDVVAASTTAPVVLVFHATWCGPCHRLEPELAAEVAARPGLRLVRVDIDEQPEVAEAQRVTGVPAVRLWRAGAEVDRFLGYRPREALAEWIDAGLAASAPAAPAPALAPAPVAP